MHTPLSFVFEPQRIIIHLDDNVHQQIISLIYCTHINQNLGGNTSVFKMSEHGDLDRDEDESNVRLSRERRSSPNEDSGSGGSHRCKFTNN